MGPRVLIIMLLCTLLISLNSAASQNQIVGWSAFDTGFERSSSAGSRITTVVGIPLVGTARQGTAVVASGFFAGDLIKELVTPVDRPVDGPARFALFQNYPNPFNPTTIISYQLPQASHVKLVVYDILGREVAELVNKQEGPGTHLVQFDARGLASGVYIYRMIAGEYRDQRKLVVLK